MSERERIAGGCSPPNPEGVLELIRRFGVWGLGGCDGCLCAHFHLLGISVDVSCHKSEQAVRVEVDGFGSQEIGADIAREVLAQIAERGYDASQYRVRFCAFRMDHQNGRWENGAFRDDAVCCYCEKPRADRDGYLCDTCIAQVPDSYPPYLAELGRSISAAFSEAE